jgi:hypothetical protein
MVLKRFRRAILALAGVLLVAASWGAASSEVRVGGRAELVGAALPLAGAGATVDFFLGRGEIDVSTATDFSLFPYTLSTEAVAVSLVRDWLSLNAEYQFSIVPIGISAATILAQATPAPWEIACGAQLFEIAVESEARLKGDAFTSTPLRAELWLRGRAGVSRAGVPLDFIFVGASLEGTLSAPNGTVWPVSTFVVSASLGCVTLASETEISFAGGTHVTNETLSLTLSSLVSQLSGEAWYTLSDEPGGVSVGLRVAYEFGASPLLTFSGSRECVGGVCR